MMGLKLELEVTLGTHMVTHLSKSKEPTLLNFSYQRDVRGLGLRAWQISILNACKSYSDPPGRDVGKIPPPHSEPCLS